MLTDGRTENRTPISHPARSRCDKNYSGEIAKTNKSEVSYENQTLKVRQSLHTVLLVYFKGFY